MLENLVAHFPANAQKNTNNPKYNQNVVWQIIFFLIEERKREVSVVKILR